MARTNDLGRDPIGPLVRRIALPSMLAQCVSVLYSIVDRMYIGHIPEVGDLALAGVGVCGPVVTLLGAFAMMIGVGGAPLMGIRMGEKKNDEAAELLSTCFWALVAMSLTLTAVLIPLKRPMLLLFGASDVTLPFADEYFTVYLIGTACALLTSGLSQFIICQGYANTAMASVMLGAVLNIILDPVFIFLLNMGVAGAAMATVISQMASCVLVLSFLLGKQVAVRLRPRHISFPTLRRVIKLGMTPFIIYALDNIMIISMNAVLQRYGGPGRGDLLVTCATIAQSFMLVVTMPLGGITGGTECILSYNYGARNTQRIREAQKHIALMAVAFTVLMTLAAWLLGDAFAGLFTQEPAIRREAVRAIRICSLAIVPLAIQYTIVDGFTGMALVKYALPLSSFRKAVYFVALFLLPALFGAEATFFAETLSDIIPPVVTTIVYLTQMPRIMRGRETDSLSQ